MFTIIWIHCNIYNSTSSDRSLSIRVAIEIEFYEDKTTLDERAFYRKLKARRNASRSYCEWFWWKVSFPTLLFQLLVSVHLELPVKPTGQKWSEETQGGSMHQIFGISRYDR